MNTAWEWRGEKEAEETQNRERGSEEGSKDEDAISERSENNSL